MLDSENKFTFIVINEFMIIKIKINKKQLSALNNILN